MTSIEEIEEKLSNLQKKFPDIELSMTVLELIKTQEGKSPLNSYMIFRKNFCARENKKQFSNVEWNNLSEKEKSFWKELSDIAKKLHNSTCSYKYKEYKPNLREKSTSVVFKNCTSSNSEYFLNEQIQYFPNTLSVSQDYEFNSHQILDYLTTIPFSNRNILDGSNFDDTFTSSYESLFSQNLTNLTGDNEAQKWLDCHYPLENRSEIKILDLNANSANSGKKLVGSLELKGFDNLEDLDCSCQWLTELDCSNCQKLKIINCRENLLTNLNLPNLNNLWRVNCSDNYLTDLNFPLLNAEKLIELDIKNNNFPRQDISIFSKFTNLENLLIGNVLVSKIDKEKFEKGIYSRFFGSLKSLQKLVKLNYLNIGNTDIDSGLEYLPDNLERIYCSTNLGKGEWKVKKIQDQLKNYKHDLHDYNYKAWKEFSKIAKEKEKEINILETRIQELTSLIKQQKEKIINAYLRFFAEKELLKELINTYLEYKKAQKQKTLASKLRQQYDKLYYELKGKIGEEQIEEVEIILNDCEELIYYEMELQAEINKNLKLIESSQQIVNNITYNIDSINIGKGHMIMGSAMGDNNDLNYQIKELLETKITVPTKKQTEVGSEKKENKDLVISKKRQLSFSSETELSCEEGTKINKEQQYQFEPTENLVKQTNHADRWTKIHPNFTPNLIQSWQSLNFTYQQVKEWIDIGFKPIDASFCAWLRDIKCLTPEQVLNHGNQEQLNQGFFNWWQEQQQSHIQIPPK